jgi:integrase/recombinase XerD
MRSLNPRRRRRRVAKAPYDPTPQNPLRGYERQYEGWALATGLSAQTVRSQIMAIRRFIRWCDERGITRPQDITRPVLERYQRQVYLHRKRNGGSLSVTAQLGLLNPVQAWFKWLARENHILINPAAELKLPRRRKGLPRGLLSVEEIEQVLNQCDVTAALGIRNRAMLETLYSCGLRRQELVNLKTYEIDLSQGTLTVRHGKGDKDRVVPIGERACAWVDKYLREARPGLQKGAENHALFLYEDGGPFPPGRLGDLVKRHLEHAGIVHPGACHLFRHAMATHMLHNSADLRSLQTILGHADLTTTQIYTHVVLDKLKDVHAATHPAKLQRDVQAQGHLHQEASGNAALLAYEGREVSTEQPERAGQEATLSPLCLTPQRLQKVCAAIEQRTEQCTAAHERAPCHEALERRRGQIGGMLELARQIDDYRLIHFLESHKDALSRLIDAS